MSTPVHLTRCLTLSSAMLFSFPALAGNVIHVPMSWCVVEGSRAEDNPNIGADSQTDAIIWRRHERPTDNIYLPQADISLRSAINDAWGSFNFPIIADPDTSLGVQGDMRGEDVNVNGVEFNAMINACDIAYDGLGRSGIGITAVNANLFHDGAGDYIGVIGWAGCSEFPAGTCIAPYDGRVVVIDNAFLHPGSPDRTFPGSSNQFIITDSLDVLTGHEVGHALSLNHRSNSLALMNDTVSDNDADDDADNTDLNAAEVAALRANALNVPGIEIDPPGIFNPGQWLQMRVPDPMGDANSDLNFMDITSARVAMNRNSKALQFKVQLADALPARLPDPPCKIEFLLDTDNDPGTGANEEQLKKLGIPRGFAGADVIMQATLVNVPGADQPALAQNSWVVQKGDLVSLNSFRAQLLEMAVYPQFAPMLKPNLPRLEHRYVANHSIAWAGQLPDEIPMGDKGRFTARIVQDGEVIDQLNKDDNRFVLEDPSFPHCFPQNEEAKQGEVALIDVEGLPANSKIHGLLGPDEVFTDITDGNGGGTFKLPVPEDTAPGPHLVTIGVIDTALTADCTLIVTDKTRCDGDLDGDGDVDNIDARIFSIDFATPACKGKR